MRVSWREWLFVLALLDAPLECRGDEDSNDETSPPPPTRVASFMVIGDWGWDPQAHGNVQTRGCQNMIATRMHEEFLYLGDVKFVVNVGDSFYPGGVRSKDDEQWHSKWRNVYSSEVRSVPWYSVYGNHDMLFDPGSCSSAEEDAAQINYNVADLDHFFMPGYSWYLQHEDLDLEVLALDLNSLWVDHTCRHTPCEATCKEKVEERAQAALKLFYERMEQSNASNMVVFSHYPTDPVKGFVKGFLGASSSPPFNPCKNPMQDYFWGHPEVIGNLTNGTRPEGLDRQGAQ